MHSAPKARNANRTRLPRWMGWVALSAGILLVAAFGLRSWNQWQFTQRMARGEVQVQTIRGWMTLPYIARVHNVPESALRAAIGAPDAGHEERSLRDWFSATGIDPVAGRRAVEELILVKGRMTPEAPP